MKKYIITLLVAFACTFMVFCDENLIILHTNDTHSQIDPDFDGKGGVLRRKAIIDSIRNVEPNVLLIDAGDVVQGTLFFTIYKGAVEFPLLDSLKYDIHIMGNHEFDNSIDSIAVYYKNLKTTLLSTNYDLSNTAIGNKSESYVIKEYDGKKFGILGININPKGIISDGNYNGLKYADEIETANKMAKWLKDEKDVDFVVVVSHIGYLAAKEGLHYDKELASLSKDIDIIIGGHSHTVINPASSKSVPWLVPNAQGKNVLICQAGEHGKYLGYIKIDLETLNANSSLIPVTKSYDDRIDKTLEKWLKPYSDVVAKEMNKEIAFSNKAMPNNKLGGLTNFVADAAFELGKELTTEKIDLAIMNRGGIRQPMPKGPVSEGLISIMFPFDNRLVVMKIKGSDLLDGLATMAVRHGDAVSSGVSVRYNKNNKITKAMINGKKIDKNKYYTIVTLDYLANGGDYMNSFKKATRIATTPIKFGTMMVDYIKSITAKGKKIDPSDESRMYRE